MIFIPILTRRSILIYYLIKITFKERENAIRILMRTEDNTEHERDGTFV